MYYGVETIKRQTRAAYGCMAAGQSPWARAWTAPMGCSLALSVWHKSAAAATVCGLWRYMSVTCICLCITIGKLLGLLYADFELLACVNICAVVALAIRPIWSHLTVSAALSNRGVTRSKMWGGHTWRAWSASQ